MYYSKMKSVDRLTTRDLVCNNQGKGKRIKSIIRLPYSSILEFQNGVAIEVDNAEQIPVKDYHKIYKYGG